MELVELLQYLIDQFGLVAALLAFAGVNYVLIVRRSRKAEAAQQAAITKQQEAITEQFNALSAERRALQGEVNGLRGEMGDLRGKLDEATDARAKLSEELKTTQRAVEQAQAGHRTAVEKALALEAEVRDLRDKVVALEAERIARAGDLIKETERASKLEKEVHDLRARVNRLEGENSALHKVIEKLNVVSVRGPEPDPPTPPSARVLPRAADEEQAA